MLLSEDKLELDDILNAKELLSPRRVIWAKDIVRYYLGIDFQDAIAKGELDINVFSNEVEFSSVEKMETINTYIPPLVDEMRIAPELYGAKNYVAYCRSVAKRFLDETENLECKDVDINTMDFRINCAEAGLHRGEKKMYRELNLGSKIRKDLMGKDISIDEIYKNIINLLLTVEFYIINVERHKYSDIKTLGELSQLLDIDEIQQETADKIYEWYRYLNGDKPAMFDVLSSVNSDEDIAILKTRINNLVTDYFNMIENDNYWPEYKKVTCRELFYSLSEKDQEEIMISVYYEDRGGHGMGFLMGMLGAILWDNIRKYESVGNGNECSRAFNAFAEWVLMKLKESNRVLDRNNIFEFAKEYFC